MLRRILGPALAGALALTLSACDTFKPNGSGNKQQTGPEAAAPTPAEIGEPLYPDQPVPPPPAAAAVAAADPIVLRQCQVSLPVTQNVPSKNDGRLMEFCTTVTDEEARRLPKDQIYEHPSALDPKKMVRYRKLKEGDVIRPGQLVAVMDNALARANYLIDQAAVTASVAKWDASKEVLNASIAEYDMYNRLYQTKSVPESDVRRSKAQQERARADVAEAKGQISKSEEEFNKAKIVLDEHEIKCTIGGVIKRFYRKPGESIKALDPVTEVQSIDRIRIEGLLEAQYLMEVEGTRNLPVIIEAAPQTGYSRDLMGHLQPVRAVAVSKDPRKPLIVSAGEDKFVRVWDRLAGQVGSLPHFVPVRAVACTPPTAAENLCLTGADDGVARLWDLDNPTTGKVLRELGSASEKHQERIICAAFAPDGKTCVTADQREIILWDVASGKLRYRFAAQHKAPITYVQYTPQSRLVSAARDRTLQVWKLGEKGAAPEFTIENRNGDVPALGVSPDGQRVLFDQERSLRLLTLNDLQRTEGVISAPSESSQFSTFALFSPDGRLVLTAGTNDMPLQLWKTPPPNGRGSLVRRLAVGAASTPTCAAFAPDSSFAVTGTQDNRVLVWEMPTKAEQDQQITATLSFVDHSISAAERKARVWAELTNPGVRLFEGDTVTLVIPRPEKR